MEESWGGTRKSWQVSRMEHQRWRSGKTVQGVRKIRQRGLTLGLETRWALRHLEVSRLKEERPRYPSLETNNNS